MEFLPSLQQLFAFLVASVLITLAPGPDNLMVLSLSIAQGRKRGMVFGLGCALGCINHTLLAAIGVSALILASPPAFFTLKLLGGLYLVWLGVRGIRQAHASSCPAASMPAETHRQLFIKGLLANTINPKVNLFFLAFLPQFVDAHAAHPGWQIMQLGVIFALQAAAIFAAIGWFAGTAGNRLVRNPARALWLQRVAGAVFVLLGFRLLLPA